MEDKKENKRIYRFLLLIAVAIPLVLSLSYAYFQAIITGNDAGVTGKSTYNFEIELITENDGYINADKLLLIEASEVVEKSQKGYFKVVSGDNKHYITYSLLLSNITISTNLQVNDFKWQLLKDSEVLTNGTFSGVTGNNMTLAEDLIIADNQTDEYELRIWLEESGLDQINLMNGSFSAKVTLVADMNQNLIPPLLIDEILAQDGGASAIEAKPTPDFNIINGTSGLYATEDDYGTSYYYRGLKTELNNNLIWAGFQWKIVRINGDGSIRIVYNGTEAQFNTNGTVNDTGANTQIGTSAWNTSYGDAKYLGYMFGGANGVASTSRNGTDSLSATYNQTNTTMKTTLDNWYKTNIYDKGYNSQVVDNLFCNDRQLQSEVGGAATGPGYGSTRTEYAASYRLSSIKKTPTLECGLKNDRFTVNDLTKGNGALTYPVGLLTADEASMAGLVYGTTNSTNYLYTNSAFWFFSPARQYSASYTLVFVVYSSGDLNGSGVGASYGVRCAVSLDSKTPVSGSGSNVDPFKVV